MLKKSRIAAQSSFDPLVYTFCDERDLLWHSLVFSAADRESAYVIDGLMHNDVVKSDIHSTDAFGYSEAIFGTNHISSEAANTWIAPSGKLSQRGTAMRKILYAQAVGQNPVEL
jgi:hypothetical protein